MADKLGTIPPRVVGRKEGPSVRCCRYPKHPNAPFGYSGRSRSASIDRPTACCSWPSSVGLVRNRAVLSSDGALPAVAAAALIIEGRLRSAGALPFAAYVLAIAAVTPLLWRTRSPLAALVGVAVGAIACVAVFPASWSASALVVVQLYTVGLLGDRQRSMVVGALTALVAVVAIVLIDGSVEPTGMGVRLLLVMMSLVLGDTVHSRRALRLAARERAQREVRQREEENRRRLADERVRIARELHDTLAHSLVAISVRASVAADVQASQDPVAALQDIKQVSATALRDLRTTLGLLREPDDGAPTAPDSDLNSLPGLIDSARAAGVRADADVSVDCAAVPSAIGRAAFRIVQEALTNVLRHADATSAIVRVERGRRRPQGRSDRRWTGACRRHASRSRPARHGRARGCVRRSCQCRPAGGRRLARLRPASAQRQQRTMSAVRVVIAEDQPMVRAGFRALLDSRSEIEVVGEAATGAEALDQVRELHPDVVVMDIRMPGMDGLEATRRITADPTLSHTRILVLTTFELDEYVFGALDAGASGFLLKGGEPAELISAVQIVARGDSLLAPSVTRRLIDSYLSRPQPEAKNTRYALEELTTREREVLGLIGSGLTNAEIAEALQLSPLTAKTHVSRILMKLGARDRVQLVIVAYQTGIAQP